MKKAVKKLKLIPLLIVTSSIFFVVTSCSTASSYSEITEEEAAYSMNLAITTALKNSASRVSSSTDKMETIPPQYSVLDEKRMEVPGLDALLTQWDESIKNHIKSSSGEFAEKLLSDAENLVFENPLEFISSSDTSGSQLFYSLYGEKIEAIAKQICKNIDYTLLYESVQQYNTYLKVTDFLYKTETPRLEEEDVSRYFSDILTTNFISALFSSEELYRTTPDPYKDRTAAVVFSVE